MIRLLAEVDKIYRKKSDTKGAFEYEILSLSATIKGPARKSFRLPPGIRGKKTTIERVYLKEWTVKKGDTIILNEEETKNYIKKQKKTDREKRWKNFILNDINIDGLPEYIFDNPFISAVITPHYGARLSHLWNKKTGKNEFYGENLFKDHGYIELSGIEETLSKRAKPDELWNAQYKRKKTKGKNKLSLVFKAKKEKTITIQKDFLFFTDFPGLLQTITIRYKPGRMPKKDKKGKKQKKKISFTQRCHFAMGGLPDFKNLFHLPLKGGMHTVRFNRPLYKRGWDDDIWWDWVNSYFTLDPGFIILEREDSEDILIHFFNKDDVEFLWTGDKKRTPRFQISYRENTLKPKKGKSYTTLISSANSYDYMNGNILFSTVGESNGDNTPISFILYMKRGGRVQSIEIMKNRDVKKYEMKKKLFKGIPGNFYQYTTSIKKHERDIVAFAKNQNLKVRIHCE